MVIIRLLVHVYRCIRRMAQNTKRRRAASSSSTVSCRSSARTCQSTFILGLPGLGATSRTPRRSHGEWRQRLQVTTLVVQSPQGVREVGLVPQLRHQPPTTVPRTASTKTVCSSPLIRPWSNWPLSLASTRRQTSNPKFVFNATAVRLGRRRQSQHLHRFLRLLRLRRYSHVVRRGLAVHRVVALAPRWRHQGAAQKKGHSERVKRGVGSKEPFLYRRCRSGSSQRS